MSQTNSIHKGMFILYNKQPHYIVEREFYKPGKGGAYNKLKLKNVDNGSILAITMRSEEKVEEIDVSTRTMQFLYCDEDKAYFMDPVTFDQVDVMLEMIAGGTNYLHTEGKYIISYYDEKPITVQVPLKLTLAVVDTAPGGDRGNTATNATKEAVLETGVKVQVPLFVKVGDRIIINTETNTYYSKE
ncbi:MAG: elongation factor P [bacterium]